MCWQWFPHPQADGDWEAGLGVPSMELDTHNVGGFDVREVKQIVHRPKLPVRSKRTDPPSFPTGFEMFLWVGGQDETEKSRRRGCSQKSGQEQTQPWLKTPQNRDQALLGCCEFCTTTPPTRAGVKATPDHWSRGARGTCTLNRVTSICQLNRQTGHLSGGDRPGQNAAVFGRDGVFTTQSQGGQEAQESEVPCSHQSSVLCPGRCCSVG